MKDLTFRRHRFTFPASESPAWKEAVDRWYQLDAFAYGFADAGATWRETVERPDLILLASPGASNASDSRFAAAGASSPSKFVHTLPNVRASSLCQVMRWNGPMLCVQKDPTTCLAALEEARLLVRTSYAHAWVIGARHLDGDHYETYLFAVSRIWSEESRRLSEMRDDEELFRWFDGEGGENG